MLLILKMVLLLPGNAAQVLHKLELFAGGGGLSYMGQKDNEHGSIVSSWANDFNASACATYACNKPYTFVSAIPYFVSAVCCSGNMTLVAASSEPALVCCNGMMLCAGSILSLCPDCY
jgi:site-specific DNA-cytosine methylase